MTCKFSVKLVKYMLSSGRTYLTVYDIWLTKTEIIIILFEPTSHCSRVDNTRRFLLVDHRSSSTVTFKVYLTEQKVTYSSLDVPSSMYYFLKDKGWTHLHLENVAECRLVFNHWRKTLKIGVG
ncbi:hypothetical protein GmHk_17G049831 [Glycine max]|nr:hypothetical protein GmHk_17G049831 [Glycine max]